MSCPLVSVVMPAYRCAGTIGQAIESVLMQDVPLELLIVVDGPDAKLEKALEPYRKDKRVLIFWNEVNLGAAESRNRGIARARGAYVAFLDGDDLWMPGKLKKQLEAMARSSAVLCATARELMRPDGKPTGRILPVKRSVTYRDLLKHNSISCSSAVIRTQIAREFPMRCEDSHEDYLFWLEIVRKYGPACGVPESLIRYRTGSTGKSGSKLQSARMTFRVYRHMGFGLGKATLLFVSYAFHGVAKYAMSYVRRKHEDRGFGFLHGSGK